MLVAASLVVGGLLAEVLVVLVAGEQPKFPRRVVGAPWGLRYNHPGAQYRHKSADVTTDFRINGQGMRSDRDVAYAKPPGTQRIVSLGDSFTIGYEVDVEECFSSVLAARLREARIDVEVLNAGVSGFSTAEELLYLERELIKYDPDVVLVSFYANDLHDNVRTNLFRLADNRLVPEDTAYVPGGRLADFLNTNGLVDALSQHSNAFAFAKEGLTNAVKRQVLDEHLAQMRAAVQPPHAGTVELDPAADLTAAIFERMYAFLRARNVPLMIHSIPLPRWSRDNGSEALIDTFPLERFDVRRPGLHFVSAKEFFEPDSDLRMLYRKRSHGHWTPLSHATSGRHLAEVVMRERLLPAAEPH